MQPHQERVVTEKKELDFKIQRLIDFIEGDIYRKLDDAEQGRLLHQLQTMKEYSNVLHERIAAFAAQPPELPGGFPRVSGVSHSGGTGAGGSPNQIPGQPPNQPPTPDHVDLPLVLNVTPVIEHILDLRTRVATIGFELNGRMALSGVTGETIANLKIAGRHLEDAHHRLQLALRSYRGEDPWL